MLYPRPALNTRNRAAFAYHNMHVESQISGMATPHRLVSMLFDGLFESLAKAKGAIGNGDIEIKGRALGKAVAIVEEGLRASLDLKGGGKVAQDLNELYIYVARRLTWANFKNDIEAIDECVRIMKPVQDAWNSISPDASAPN
jgi:flagellar secretion chaperone FliS